MENEIWKRIPGYSLYEVSNLGRLKTYNWKGSGREAIMKPAIYRGYCKTMIKNDEGRTHTIQVHKMVALAFLTKKENDTEINHINGVRNDNRVENLEWCTHSENLKHSFKIGLSCNAGSQNPTSKLTEAQVLEIRAKFIPRVYGRRQLAFEYKVYPSTIKDIIMRKSWKHI